ncbi:MAG: hypothetical protein FJ222_06955 [Lentisphaerae bacterium]|nr:hypothetical protein [Lentisphaerota bacterium]
MAPLAMTPPDPVMTNAWFTDAITLQGTTYLSRVSFSSLADAPASYLAFNPGFLLGRDGSRVVQINAPLDDCATNLWTGSVTVNLMSVYEVEESLDAHVAQVSVGGKILGPPATWPGEQYQAFTYPFSFTNLTGNAAVLKVENLATEPAESVALYDYTRFLCMSCTFTYPRLYRARNGALRCTGGESNTVAVSGFASNDVAVLDVTTTHAPVVVEPVTLTRDGAASNWIAAFPCGGSGQVYQVFSKSAGVRQPAVRGVRDVDWESSAHAADYVMLIPPEGWCVGFRAALQDLAAFRNAQGLRTVIVDVESLYNRYSFGLVDPLAIRAFCATGLTAWGERPLRYLLLAGAGALDFKHQRFSVNDYTACLIPTIIAGQRFNNGLGMTAALDAALGDVDSDGLADVAIGRLPTTRTQEVALAVQKTKAYEGAWLRRDGTLAKRYAAVAPDWSDNPDPNKDYPFDIATDKLIAPLQAAGRTFVSNYPHASDPSNLIIVKTNSLIPALKAGSGLFHFFGHSNKSSIGFDPRKLLRASTTVSVNDIKASNWTNPMIAVMIGCQVNVWQFLTSSITIIPYGLFEPNTGFAAAIGTTGFFLDDEGDVVGVDLYSQATADGTVRLGDVLRLGVRRAAQNPLISSRPGVRERLMCLSLSGDPALVFRHDVTARGTEVAGLVQYGQLAPNADLADPDLDGWRTWQELQARTDPTNFVLRITDARLSNGERRTIAFEAASNRTYHIEHNASLLATDDWQAVSWAFTNATDWAAPGTAIAPQAPLSTVAVPVSTVTTQGFYRLRRMD